MKLNDQAIEKREYRIDGNIDVHSIFYTIQGEGPFCGTPAIFVRLAGCNLQCPACDTEYTKGRKMMGPRAIVAEVNEIWRAEKWRPGCLVVITGGEPFRQDLSELLKFLEFAGYYVQIETNGTLPPSSHQYNLNISERNGTYIVCSPKTGRVHPEIWKAACCAKYVLEAGNMRESDGLPLTALMHTANPHVARPPEWWANETNRPIYLQPMDAKNTAENARNVMAVRDSCMKHGYILQLQIHKIIGVE